MAQNIFRGLGVALITPFKAYWLANDKYYNPYWGYQNGKKRNSRVINDFSPSAIMTW